MAVDPDLVRVPGRPTVEAAPPRRRPSPASGRAAIRALALRLALPSALLAVLYAESELVGHGYPLDRAAAVNGALVAVAPFVAVSAAWEMQALRCLWGRLVVTRAWWLVLVGRLRLTAGIGLAMVLLGHAAALAWPPAGWTGWSFPLLSVLTVLAWTAAGAAIGLSARPVAALPAALLVPFVALNVPHGWEPLWLRHLTGLLESCCSTSEVLDPRAVRASAAVLAAVLVVSLCVARVRLLPAGSPPAAVWRTAAVALVAVVATAQPIAAVRALGPFAWQDRPLDELVCADDLCLWPEDEHTRAANTAARQRVFAAWEGLGLPAPAAAIGPLPGPSMLALATRVDDPDVAALGMAAGLPRELRGCRDDYDDEERNRALDRLSALLLVRLGADPGGYGLADVGVADPADAGALWASTTSC